MAYFTVSYANNRGTVSVPKNTGISRSETSPGGGIISSINVNQRGPTWDSSLKVTNVEASYQVRTWNDNIKSDGTGVITAVIIYNQMDTWMQYTLDGVRSVSVVTQPSDFTLDYYNLAYNQYVFKLTGYLSIPMPGNGYHGDFVADITDTKGYVMRCTFKTTFITG